MRELIAWPQDLRSWQRSTHGLRADRAIGAEPPGAPLLLLNELTVHASDLMQSDPLTLTPATPFLEIVRLFVQGRISGAPVVDEQGTVPGVISMTDLLRAVDQACDEDIEAEPARGDSSSRPANLPVLLSGSASSPRAISPPPIASASRPIRRSPR